MTTRKNRVNQQEQWRQIRLATSLKIPGNSIKGNSWNVRLQAYGKHGFSVRSTPPPVKFDETVRWLNDNALQHKGNITLRKLRLWRGFNYCKYKYSDRLIDILESPPNSRKRKNMQKNARFLEAVKLYLGFWGQRKAIEGIRQRRWGTIDVSGDFNETVKSLRALRDNLVRFSSSFEPLSHRASRLLIPDSIAGFGIEFDYSDAGASGARKVTAVFHAIRHNCYGIDCSCGELLRQPCPHVRILVEWLLDILGTPEEAAHAVLLERLRIPQWKLGVHRLKDELEAVAKRHVVQTVANPGERLVWRINPGAQRQGKWIVEPILQSQNRNGSWSRGRKITESEWRTEDLQALIQNHPPARAYLRVLSDKNFADRDTYSQQLCEFMTQLVDEPNVLLQTDSCVPTRVVCHRVVFAVLPTDNGFRTVIEIGNWHIKPHIITAYTISPRHMYVIDSKAGTFILGSISEATLPFVRFCAQTSEELPMEALPELFSLMSQSERPDVWIHPSLRGKSVPPDTRIVARITPRAEFDFNLSLHVYPTGCGAACDPGCGPSELVGEVKGTRVFVERELQREIEAATFVADALALPMHQDKHFRWHIDSPEKALDVLSLLNQLPNVEVEWPEGAAALRVLRAGTPSLKVIARQKCDWFRIGGTVSVDNIDVPFRELLRAVQNKQRYVRLQKGEYLVIQKDLYQKLSELAGLGEIESDGEIVIPPSGVPFVDQQLQALSFSCDDSWHNVKARMAESAAMSPDVPNTFNGRLRTYQMNGFNWLACLSYWSTGACLADDMGLGKTLQTLALVLWKNSTKPSVIVSPMSVCHNWINEASVFTPSLDMRLFHGVSREQILSNMTGNTVLVTSYDTLTSNVERLKEVSFNLIVMDEAQLVKNALSKRAKAVSEITADFRLALTGTPVENHLGDLWSIFHAILPGLLGTYERFKKQYAVPIERRLCQKSRALLVQQISPFLLRRTKSQVLPELPPRIETVSQVALEDKHMALYNNERQRILDELETSNLPPGQRRFSALSGLTRLRRLACHPRLTNDASDMGSAKMERIIETIQDLMAQEQRALVFSQFTGHLSLLQHELQRVGIRYLYLDGSTPQQTRGQLAAKWHDEQTPLFIISLKAGGFGLNLTGADYVLHLDPWWNPAAEDQATDRTHRIGQTKPVTVVRFIACNTVEEGVVSLHEQKRELAESILDNADCSDQLSPDDLIALIRGVDK